MKKFRIPIQIRFRDLDAMGHVNNAVYFSFFEVGRLKFFIDVLNVKTPEDFPFILAKAEADFLKPVDLSMSDDIWLNVFVGDLGKKSFKFFYELVNGNESVKFAEGLSVQVFYDYNCKKSIPVPEDFKEKVKEYIKK